MINPAQSKGKAVRESVVKKFGPQIASGPLGRSLSSLELVEVIVEVEDGLGKKLDLQTISGVSELELDQLIELCS